MDTRPYISGKSFSRSPKQKRRGLRSHEMLLRNGKTAINDKKRKPLLLERLPPYIYFQSLKMSANAKSSAVFMLFSIKDRISASNTDFFFFLLRSFT